jgi:hypothetical protein
MPRLLVQRVTLFEVHATGGRSISMRVQASLQFSCAATGRNLETKLSTETRNLVLFRRGNMPMCCVFCGRQHYWRLVEYQRQRLGVGMLRLVNS